MGRILGKYYFEDGAVMEYTIAGSGPPVLMMHGGHSNSLEDFGYDAILAAGYSVLTPSRPGYGETSVCIGETLRSAVEAYRKLLDFLDIAKVDVLAMSAGGPSGIQFASLFPERVRSLTLQSAVTKPWMSSTDREYAAARLLFHPLIEKGTWRIITAMARFSPSLVFRLMASSFSMLPYSAIGAVFTRNHLEQFHDMLKRQRSQAGFLLDIEQTQAVMTEELKNISCPMLILHSRHDNSVPPAHAFHAKKLAPHAELQVLDHWGHLLWIGPESENVNRMIISFLRTGGRGHD
ncbi:alpha/beta fold hydrolase [Salibacterium aidingense]|uniref:alpha/beta fold hydrolase n=1 Tax=Salibacterium aidingense TaxID=384933 RepID=UPI0004093C72|nr:alpha/beta hydrolase [Salibacterium aidingense]